MPLLTEYVNTVDGGRVAEIYVKDGDILKRNQPILKLINTDVEMSMANTATNVSSTLANMQLAEVNAQQNTVGKLNSAGRCRTTLSGSQKAL